MGLACTGEKTRRVFLSYRVGSANSAEANFCFGVSFAGGALFSSRVIVYAGGFSEPFSEDFVID